MAATIQQIRITQETITIEWRLKEMIRELLTS